MNKVYRIIWNSTLGRFVVASELAKGRIKSSSTSGNVASARPAFMFKALSSALFVALSGGVAYAADAIRLDGTKGSYSDVDVVTTIEKGYGVYSNGTDADIGFTGGSISTSGAGAYGAVAGDGGVMTLDGTKVNTTGTIAYGLYSTRGSQITGSNLNITTSNADAVFVASNSSVNVSDSTINSGGRGLVAGVGSTINVDNTTINSAGTAIFANSSTITGKQVTVNITADNGYGLSAAGTNSNITLTDSDISTKGTAALALIATGAGNSIDISNSNLSTDGYTSSVITVDGATVNASNVGISSFYTLAHGASVIGDNSALTLKDSTISTGYGYGVSVGGTNATVDVQNSAITVSESQAKGINVTGSNNNINIANSTINTAGLNGQGINVTGNDNTLSVSDSSIKTNNSSGVYVTGNSTVSLSNVEIDSALLSAVVTTGSGATINVDGSTFNSGPTTVKPLINISGNTDLNITNSIINSRQVAIATGANANIAVDNVTFNNVNAVTGNSAATIDIGSNSNANLKDTQINELQTGRAGIPSAVALM